MRSSLGREKQNLKGDQEYKESERRLYFLAKQQRKPM